MKCKICGFNNPDDSLFCQECGQTIVNKTESSPSLHGEIEEGISDVLFAPKKKPSHIMRNIFIITAVISFLLILGLLATESENNTNNALDEGSNNAQTQTSSSNNDWQPFTSVEQGFTASYPTSPSAERIPEEKINGITYSAIQYVSSIDENTTYLIQVADYDIPPSQYDNKIGLEGMVNAMANEDGGTLTSSSFREFLGYDAVDFAFTSGNGYYGKGVAFIRDDLTKIKALILMVFAVNINSSEYNRFINSFRLN